MGGESAVTPSFYSALDMRIKHLFANRLIFAPYNLKENQLLPYA
jgi:hypothetical protein